MGANPLLHLIFSKAPTGVIDPVMIDMGSIIAIESICASNPYVRAAVEQATYLVVGNGINIKLTQRSTGRVFPTTNDMAIVMEREIQPFIADFFKQILYYGFCVYNTKESSIIQGLVVPNIPKFGSWDLIVAYLEKDMSSVYFVVDSKTLGRNRSIASAKTNPFGVMKGASVAVVEHPTPEGKLRSCMVGIYDQILRLHGLQNDLVECSSKRAHPDFVTESSAVGNNLLQNYAQTPPSSTRYMEGDILALEEEYSNFTEGLRAKQLNLAIQQANLQRAGYKVIQPNPLDPMRPISKEVGSSWASPFRLPHGQTVSHIAQPDTISTYKEAVSEILTSIALAIGIPKEWLLPSGSRASHAANAELQMKETDGRVKAWQTRIIPVIADILEKIWNLGDEELIVELCGTTPPTTDKGSELVDNSYFPKQTEDYYSNDNGEESLVEYMGMVDEQLFTKLSPTDPKLRELLSHYLNEESNSQTTREVNLADILGNPSKTLDELRVTVAFNQAPLTTKQSLIEARERCIIGEQDFKTQFLNVSGIPSWFQLDEEESRRQRTSDLYAKLDEIYKQEVLKIKIEALRAEMPQKIGSKRSLSELDGQATELSSQESSDNSGTLSESETISSPLTNPSKKKKTNDTRPDKQQQRQENGGQVSRSEILRERVINKVSN